MLLKTNICVLFVKRNENKTLLIAVRPSNFVDSVNVYDKRPCVFILKQNTTLEV